MYICTVALTLSDNFKELYDFAMKLIYISVRHTWNKILENTKKYNLIKWFYETRRLLLTLHKTVCVTI